MEIVIISVSDPDPVGSRYFDRLGSGSGSGLNTRIPDPDPQNIEFIEFSYLVLKLIIGSAQSQPQGLKNVFNRVESYSAGLFTYESTYDNRKIF